MDAPSVVPHNLITQTFMEFDDQIAKLRQRLDELPKSGMNVLGEAGSPAFVLDFIVVAAVKRTLSLGHGFISMVESKNMTCSRALLRMQIDTVSRLLAYTYVDEPEQIAQAVIGGEPLRKFKSREGKPLTDGYLIDRMTEEFSWTRRVYDHTSGDIHFSEHQFFSSIYSMQDNRQGGYIKLMISQFDTKFPESSWSEAVMCFIELCRILNSILLIYAERKTTNMRGESDA